MRDLINCQPALYAYILSLLPNREDANDVLQDANLVMWRRSDEFVEGTNFLAWAYQIARYKVLAHHRDCHRDRHIFDDGLFAQLADQADRRAGSRGGGVVVGRLRRGIAPAPTRVGVGAIRSRRLGPGDGPAARPVGLGLERHPVSDPSLAAGLHPTQAGREGKKVNKRKGDRSNLPERPEGCYAQIGPVPFSLVELGQLIGDLVNEQLTDAGRERLIELLRSGPAARGYYLDYMALHSRLQRKHEPQGLGAEAREVESEEWRVRSEEDSGVRVQGSVAANPQSTIHNPQLLSPPIILDLSPAPHSPPFTLHSPVGSFLFSYTMASLFLGLALLIGWAWRTSSDQQLARTARPQSARIVEHSGRRRWWGAFRARPSAAGPIPRPPPPTASPSPWAEDMPWPRACWRSLTTPERESSFRVRPPMKSNRPAAAFSRGAS